MLFKEMTAEHYGVSQTLLSTKSHDLKMKQTSSVLNLLREKMGMSHAGASDVAMHVPKYNPPAAYFSTFLHAAIQEQIDEYRKQTFSKFGLVVSVYPSRNAKQMEVSVEHFGRVTVGYHSYTFNVQHNKTPEKAMHVRLHRGSIQVRFCGSWQPISSFLDEIGTEWTYPECMKSQLRRQHDWWNANGKFFEITRLPGEIRNAIFDFVFPSEAQPFPTSKKNDRLAPTYQHSYTALMRTNTQLSQEASDWLYQRTTFSIEHPPVFPRRLENGFPLYRLRRVRLALGHSQYLDMFSGKPWIMSDQPYVKRQFREMSNLECFEVHFSAPSRIATKTWLEGACQRTAVNMIIDAAWPSIKGLPITITGYVKHSQKREIEARVQSARNIYAVYRAFCRDIGKPCTLGAYDAWVQWMTAEQEDGVRLDGEPWVEIEVEAEEDNGLQWNEMCTQDLMALMWCNCEKRCSLDTWDPAD